MDTQSIVSETDHMLFTVLSNPDRIDFAAIQTLPDIQRQNVFSYDDVPRIEELPVITEEQQNRERHREISSEDEHARNPEFGHAFDHMHTIPAVNIPPQTTSTTQLPSLNSHTEAPPQGHTDAPPQGLPEQPQNCAGTYSQGIPGACSQDPPEAHPISDPSPPEVHPGREFHAPPLPQEPPAFVPPSAPSDDFAKRTVLLDLRQLEMQGAKLSKEWSMEDRTEDMMMEMRRITLAMDEVSNVNMMRDGMRLTLTGIEMINKRIGLLDLDGWSSEVCRDLQKHDANLSRIYRKYWKRSHSTSPEVDICMSLIGSMGMYHMKRKMSKQVLNGSMGGGGRGGGDFPGMGTNPFAFFNKGGGGGSSSGKRRQETPNSSDDEGVPP